MPKQSQNGWQDALSVSLFVLQQQTADRCGAFCDLWLTIIDSFEICPVSNGLICHNMALISVLHGFLRLGLCLKCSSLGLGLVLETLGLGLGLEEASLNNKPKVIVHLFCPLLLPHVCDVSIRQPKTAKFDFIVSRWLLNSRKQTSSWKKERPWNGLDACEVRWF